MSTLVTTEVAMPFGSPRTMGIGTVLYKLHTDIGNKAVGIEKCIVIGESGPGLEDGERIFGKWTTWDIAGENGGTYHPYTHHCLDGFYFEYEKAVEAGYEKSQDTYYYARGVIARAEKSYDHFAKLKRELK